MKKRKLLQSHRGFYIFLCINKNPKAWMRCLVISRSSYTVLAKTWKQVFYINTPDRELMAIDRAIKLIDKHLNQNHVTTEQNTANS